MTAKEGRGEYVTSKHYQVSELAGAEGRVNGDQETRLDHRARARKPQMRVGCAVLILLLLGLTTTVAAAVPATPANPAPGTVGAPGPVQPSSNVTLSWSGVTGATYYSLGVRNMATNVLVVDTTTTNMSYPASLAAGGQYRWNVAACNASGCSSYTTPLYFQTPGTVPATKVLDVPFIHQMCDTPYDDNFNGCWACGGTSAVMILAYYGKLSPWPFQPTYCSNTPVSNWGNYVNNIYPYDGYTFDKMTLAPKQCGLLLSCLDNNTGTPAYGAYGFIHYSSDCNTAGNADPDRAVMYFQDHGLTSRHIRKPKEADVQAEIDGGHPVWASTNLWASGHIVVIKGYTSVGTSNSVQGSSCSSSAGSPCSASNVCYIVNDPWPCGHSSSARTGEGYLYTWSQMQTGSKWIVTAVSLTADFNGDGKTDILWRNKSTGQNIIWLMDGTTYSNYTELLQVPDTNWQIVGTGDFNGDGKTDILWRNKSTGQNIVWLMDGTTYSNYAELLQVTDTNWEIVGPK